jgi:hypothetical protein
MKRTPTASYRPPYLWVMALFICLHFSANVEAKGRMGEAHRHGSRAAMLSEIAPGVSFVRVKPPEIAKRENLRKTVDGRFLAYTASAGGERLFVKDTRTRVVYEVQGIPLGHRPFSDLRWFGRSRLVFDRWSQPHHGMHYELDIRQKRLVVAYAFPG